MVNRTTSRLFCDAYQRLLMLQTVVKPKRYRNESRKRIPVQPQRVQASTEVGCVAVTWLTAAGEEARRLGGGKGGGRLERLGEARIACGLAQLNQLLLYTKQTTRGRQRPTEGLC
ncbi:hypothetical protein NHX12_031658 [Muraenolepis orangiensis]|uniref:Uncharacterized protein n=1 Tax=Muraenolepis orangiensis TaxID=630683 RepID=A0A9Q0E896_9TELE|nr:hypothetical protein NHX12_031658 [Muraenolepis orangiensis]